MAELYGGSVLLIGLTGGIGSGKSTVSALLAEKGAVIIDADAITHELQQPGQPVFDAMVERFGKEILADDGSLDRAHVGSIVFNDEAAKKDLEAIVRRRVRAEMLERMQAESNPDQLVVYDVPLLVEAGRAAREFRRVSVLDKDHE